MQSSFKKFIHYTVLSLLGTLGVSCYILADTFFVSKGLGTNGLAALNIAIPVYNFIYGIGMMLGIGGATKFSVYKSQNRSDEGNKIYTNTIYLAIIFSVFFVLLGVCGSNRIALMLGADENILEMTDIYIRWLLLFAPAFILNDIFLCFIRNDEAPKLSMMAMLTGSFVNIILDYIFIFLMKMGIFGAIFATGLSPLISILMMLPHWMRKKNHFHFIKTKMYADMVWQNFSLGFPSFVAQVSAGIVMIIFNMLILQLKGNTGVAAYGVIANISIVLISIYTGIAQGIQPVISSAYGKGDDREIKMVFRYAMIAMAAISIIVYALIFIFAQPIASVFNSEHHQALQNIAVNGLKIYFLSSIFAGYNIILAMFFTSLEKALPAQILSVLRGFILIIPMVFILSSVWGMTGIWLTYPITEFLVAIMGYGMYRKYHK